MNDQNARYARLRHTATGAVVALAVVGAIAGAVALAAQPRADTHGHAAAAKRSTTKMPTSPAPDKTDASRPAINQQPFLNAIQRLVDTGTIAAAEGQAVDRDLMAGGVDTDTVTSGFTQTQLQAVQQALGNAKRALLPSVSRTK